jgi:hypothetical protein
MPENPANRAREMLIEGLHITARRSVCKVQATNPGILHYHCGK